MPSLHFLEIERGKKKKALIVLTRTLYFSLVLQGGFDFWGGGGGGVDFGGGRCLINQCHCPCSFYFNLEFAQKFSGKFPWKKYNTNRTHHFWYQDNKKVASCISKETEADSCLFVLLVYPLFCPEMPRANKVFPYLEFPPGVLNF